MGRHATGSRRRRRPAAWLVVVTVTAVVVAALTVGYFVIINRHDDPLACTGSAVLPVVAAPGAAAAVNDVAAAFNSTGPIARSTCVSVSVSAMSGASTVAALAAGWRGRPTPAPGLWVVDSAADVAALDADNAAMTAGNTNTDLATSPVVLAVRSAPGAAVGSWQNVADGAPGLKIAMPDPGANRASRYALESILASSTPGGAGAPIAAGAVAAAAPTLLRLARSVPTAPTTTAAALTELSAGTSSYSAIPVVESELADFNAANPPGLTAVYPTGGTAGDAILAIPLTAPWINSAISDAAAKFDAFLSDSKGLAILAKAGLRTGGRPGTAAGVSLSTAVIRLPETSKKVRDLLSRAWSAARSSAPPSTSTASPSPSIATTTVLTTAPTTTTAATTSAPTATSAPAVVSLPIPTGSSTGSSTAPTTQPTATRPPATSTSRPKIQPAQQTQPAQPSGPAVTLLLDTSSSMSTPQGNLQRIMWVQSAVIADIQKSPTALFGLWAFSTHEAATGYALRVSLGALTDPVDGQTRAVALAAQINALKPGGDSWTYGAIRAAYAQAVSSAVAGRANRVVVLTDGPDSTPGVSRTALMASIAALAAQNRSVTLDIIGLSGDVNAEALIELAGAGGGSFTPVGDLTDLQPTLLRVLGS